MVYCSLKEKHDTQCVYYFGGNTSDLSGEVVFFSDARTPVILKEPETHHVGIAPLAQVNAKYHKDFIAGIFKDRISYECG